MSMASPDTPLYNSRIFDSCIKLLKKKYDYVSIPGILRHAGMKELEISDRGHWFTQRQSDLFYEKAVQLCGNPGLAREAGRYSFSTEALGALREYLLALAGPEYLLTIGSRVAANFTRSCRITTRKIGPRQFEATIFYEEGVRESPYQCENRLGFLEAVFLLYGYHCPEIHHSECVFQGAAVCRYQISWEDSSANSLPMVRRLCFLLLPLIILCAVWLAPGSYIGSVFLSAVLLYLLLFSWTQRVERTSLFTTMGAMRASSEMLLGQIKGNYDSALMINEIGEVISSRTDLDDILASVNQVLLKRLDYGRGVLLLANSDQSALVLRSSFGLNPQETLILQSLEHPVQRNAPLGVFIDCFIEQKSLMMNDIADPASLFSEANRSFLSALEIRSFICAPIVCEGESLGILIVDDPKRDGGLLQSDLSLIQGVAPVIGIAIRNAMRLANERDLSEQLRKASELLEKRVEERTAELSRANEVLEFLYDSVSHDLRTPLRVIYGYGELLLDGYADQLDDTARGYLSSMITGGERMEGTLNRMLDFSQIRLMALTVQSVDLSLMARRILNDLQVTDPRRVLSARVAERVVVQGDEGLLTSIMENLLENAWKYSAARAISNIEFGVRDGIFFVSDNGDGFDMALADRLFAPFQRLHDAKTFAGHGLGLSMVRCMIERLGGKVWGVGSPGEGATFYFTLADIPSVESGVEARPLN